MFIAQKILLASSIERGNPIHPLEWTYIVAMLMLVMNLATMKLLKEDLYPIPKKIRTTYIVRCVVGMMCNLTFLLSLKFIPFSKASVLFWTSPVFTAILAHYYLHEKLSYYDWGAVLVAFIGILII
jgi:drug/metabolite transporter (DMT)-like permease